MSRATHTGRPAPLATVAAWIVATAAALPGRADDPAAIPWSPVAPQRLTAEYWIARAPGCERVLLDAEAVAAQNARVVAAGPGLHDLARLPRTLPAATVAAWVEALAAGTSARPVVPDGAASVPEPRAWLALDRLPAEVTPRFALCVRRTDLRSYPTDLPGRTKPTDTDIDRYQESALFPGTPVAVVHTSGDGRWAFVIAPHYAAWVAIDAIAEGDRDAVLGFAATATRVVTGATVRTVATAIAPDLSELSLDMGVALPEVVDWPFAEPVNGQGTLGALVVRFPTRAADGRLAIRPALLSRSADTHHGPLAASRANLIRQAFKFLGERYCWGHRGGGRDCSGFVGECYRSLGLILPRNSKDQAVCNASFQRTALSAGSDRAARMAALATLEPGDLVHVPGHVMMAIGADERGPWIIHDSHAATVRGPDGRPMRIPTNSVVVCPLEPLLRDDGTSLVDAIIALQRYLPPATASAVAPDTPASGR